MSRTTRKRIRSFEDAMGYSLQFETNRKIIGRLKAHWMNRKYYGWSMSKDFRNSVNRVRRKKDRHEIWKAVNLFDYPEQCSDWTCKDANQWGYF